MKRQSLIGLLLLLVGFAVPAMGMNSDFGNHLAATGNVEDKQVIPVGAYKATAYNYYLKVNGVNHSVDVNSYVTNDIGSHVKIFEKNAPTRTDIAINIIVCFLAVALMSIGLYLLIDSVI